MNSAQILVVGADGMLGRHLSDTYKLAGTPVWETTRHKTQVGGRKVFLDLSEDLAQWRLPAGPIKTAFLCAAVTSQEECRREPELTRKVNVFGAVSLAKRLVQDNVFVVYLSSNLVFDGEASYAKSTDSVNPRTEYGRQKADAEEQLLKLGPKIAIIRFGKVISRDMFLFQSWIRDLLAGKTIHPFSDMVMAPIPLAFAVEVLRAIEKKQAPGIFQSSATQDVSYAYVAQLIAQKLGVAESLIEPISYRESEIKYSPHHGTLDSSTLAGFGLYPPSPFDAIEKVLSDMLP